MLLILLIAFAIIFSKLLKTVYIQSKPEPEARVSLHSSSIAQTISLWLLNTSKPNFTYFSLGDKVPETTPNIGMYFLHSPKNV